MDSTSPWRSGADGRLFAAAGTDALHVWEASTGKRVLHLQDKGRFTPLQYDGFPTCLAWSPDGKLLATGHGIGTVLLWDMTKAWQALAPPAGPGDTAACWEALGDFDPKKAYAAIDQLASVADKSLPLLRQKLVPVKVEPKWLASRLADLNNDNFAIREAAQRDLDKVAEAVESDLRRMLEKPPSLEVRNRLLAILKPLEAGNVAVQSPDQLRQLRGITVLERIGSKEAQTLLGELAAGAVDAPLTREARAALQRLGK